MLSLGDEHSREADRGLTEAEDPDKGGEVRYPTHPVWSLERFPGSRRQSVPSILDTGKVLTFTSGRYGLAKALQLSNVGAGDDVLLPAYCCPAMVGPIEWLGARPVFYRVHEDLEIDLGDVARKVGPRTKSVIAVHYFGFLRDLATISKWCDRQGLTLIEDCAHCLYGVSGCGTAATYGDFAFTSLYKFFPIFDGGCIVVRDRSIPIAPSRTGSLLFQMKSLVGVLERAQQYGRLPGGAFWRALFRMKDFWWNKTKQRGMASARPLAPPAAHGGFKFKPEWMDVRMSFGSAALLKMCSPARLVERRRENYLKLLSELSSVKGCRPLYSVLPEGVVPYMFPMFVDEPSTVYPALKSAGVPVLRWDDAESSCDVSRLYSRHLLFVACHQELTLKDIAWIARTIEATVSTLRSSRGTAIES
jgi:perosamine synthetase